MINNQLNSKSIGILNFVFLLLQAAWYYYEGFPINKLIPMLSFYTNFTHSSVVIYQIWSIIEATFQKQQSLKLKRFQTFLVYECLIVSISFWTIYMIQPHAVISKSHPISKYILLTFHGGSFLYLYFVSVFTNGFQYSGNMRIAKISGSFYIFFVILNYIIYDKVPYPFLKRVHPLLGITLIALTIFIISSLYVFLCKRFIGKQNDEKNKNQ